MMLGRGLYFCLFSFIVALIVPSPEAWRILPSGHNVLLYGAVGDDLHDDTNAFLEAWEATCNSPYSMATLIVPSGKTFYINPLIFKGPCKSPYINVQINGHIVAPKYPTLWQCNGDCETWIEFQNVDGISIHGQGTIDGRGQRWWDLQSPRPTALKISHSTNVHLRGLHFTNNPRMHLVLEGLQSAYVTDLHIDSPENSPNTDGIHVAYSNYVTIAHSKIQTGDDCISIVDGASYVQVHNIMCGPGHGISIGSLGKHGEQDMVEYVHVSDVVFNRTTNGARIKTWQGGRGYAKHITFERITIIEADNPIIVDQFYCDHEICSDHEDAVKISDVTFKHVFGTSKGKTAVTLDCSRTVPCQVFMEDIHIRSSKEGESVTSQCTSANCQIRGTNVPQISCIS